MIFMKRFAYLIQSPDYVPSFVKDIKTNDSDVYILTFKKPIDYPNSIFCPAKNCTWTNGRNKLAEMVMDKGYLYNIFMDDDIILKIDPKMADNKKNPWRMFEDFLLTHQPALGTCRYKKKHFFDPSKKVDTTYQCDGMLNAIHRDMMKFHYPLCNNFDNKSWWWSQFFAICKMAVFYKGYVLQCNSINMINPRHFSYPQAYGFQFAKKIFLSTLLHQKDKDMIVPNFLKNVVNNGEVKTYEEGVYIELAKRASERVKKDSIIWKNIKFY